MRFIALLFLILPLSGCFYMAGLQNQLNPFPRFHYNDVVTRAESGDPKAQVELAAIEYSSCHPHECDLSWKPKCDPVQEIKWNIKAAYLSDVLAQERLASLYEEGWGIQKDYVQAYLWSNVAAKSDKAIEQTIKRISSKMTPAQIVEGKRLLAEWKPTPAAPTETKH